jgi:hypothetical protein
MILQCKYFRASEGWDLEQQLNEFISKLPRESLVDIKMTEYQATAEPTTHFVSALLIYVA